jgi:hypothetical protein
MPIKKIIPYQIIWFCLLSVQTSWSRNIKPLLARCGADWVSDSEKIVTVSVDSGNIQLWDEKATLLKTIN